MFTINRTFNVIDTAFSAGEVIERFDAVAVGEKVINISATVAAIVIGVCSYVWTALLPWWEDNGEVITVGAIRFVINTVDFAGWCYQAGRKVRPQVNLAVNHLADTAFFKLAALV
jgi:hypothetical protein